MKLYSKLRHNSLQPALTPLLLIAQKRLGSHQFPITSRTPDSWFVVTHLVNTVRGTTLVAVVAMLALSNGDLRASALSAVPVAALLVVYIALVPKNAKGHRFLPLVDIADHVVPLSLRVVLILVVALGIETVAFGFPRSTIGPTLLLGVAKASSWYFTTQTVRGLLLYENSMVLIDFPRLAILLGASRLRCEPLASYPPVTHLPNRQTFKHCHTS
jgi:hypothetical protein